MNEIQIEQLVPGGIKATDHIHKGRNDGTCSRCRKMPAEDDVPLMFWAKQGTWLWIYCEKCLGVEPVH
jgi:hypothetical protein